MTNWDEIKADRGNIDYFFTLGTKEVSEDEIQVSVWRPRAAACELCTYGGGKKRRFLMYPADAGGGSGLFTIRMKGENITGLLQGTEYEFASDGEVFADPCAREIAGRERFGRKHRRIRAKFDFADFDWSGENRRTLPTDEIVMYQCHMRGFTKHKSSGVQYPGTFAGMREKIPYLKELGVNTLFCLPVYEFDEHMADQDGEGQGRVNFWGYGQDAFYFAPKQSYASGVRPAAEEFQQLVKELHRQGMNIYLDMYFVERTPTFIVQCLRYYALRFHIDGFRVNEGCIDKAWITDDPVLDGVRLLGSGWTEGEDTLGEERRMEMNDGFLVDARRFLKSDEGQAENFYRRFREQRKGVALVHYITQHNGFTLRDLISYDIKHNEANGEKNQDGTEYNFSWNCGVEGSTRRKDVLARRQRQEKNALIMLLLGMPVPMLLAGDEFGNTQKGNNNAYCQDNATTWLDWRLLEKNQETFRFVRQLLKFRKEHALYHGGQLLTGMDAKGLGMPDVSCHGKEPWETRFSNYSREVGILYYGGYNGGQSLYFAFNLHWEPHDFFLPGVRKGEHWRLVLDTSGRREEEEPQKSYVMQPRTIAIFECVKEKKKKKKRNADAPENGYPDRSGTRGRHIQPSGGALPC